MELPTLSSSYYMDENFFPSIKIEEDCRRSKRKRRRKDDDDDDDDDDVVGDSNVSLCLYYCLISALKRSLVLLKLLALADLGCDTTRQKPNIC